MLELIKTAQPFPIDFANDLDAYVQGKFRKTLRQASSIPPNEDQELVELSGGGAGRPNQTADLPKNPQQRYGSPGPLIPNRALLFRQRRGDSSLRAFDALRILRVLHERRMQ